MSGPWCWWSAICPISALPPRRSASSPEYSTRGAFDLLRGFLSRSRWIAVCSATVLAATGIAAVHWFEPYFTHHLVLPLSVAFATLPFYTLMQMQDGIARAHNWVHIALLPGYAVRHLIMLTIVSAAWLFGFPADAQTAVIAVAAALLLTVTGQTIVLNRKLAQTIAPGPKAHDTKTWFAVSLPILIVEGFYLLLTNTDILMLQHFRSPEDVAVYYAAAKTLVLIAFVHFAVSAAVGHRFSECHVTGDRERLQRILSDSIRWTFWGSLAACAVILAMGPLLLSLFGDGFVRGYHLMAILAVGLMARASLGPVERLLNMLDEQHACAGGLCLGLRAQCRARHGADPADRRRRRRDRDRDRAGRRVGDAVRHHQAAARLPRLHLGALTAMHAPLRQSYQVEWRSLAELAPIADEWRALAASAIEPNVFYEPAFALAAASGVRHRHPRRAGADDGRQAGRAVSRPSGAPDGGRLGASLRTARRAAGRPRRARGRHRRLARSSRPGPGDAGPAPAAVPARAGRFRARRSMRCSLRDGRRSEAFSRHERALLAPGDQRQHYLERAMSAGKRKELRRQRRRLEDIAPVTADTVTDAAGIEAALKDFMVLEASGWKGIAGTAMVNDPAIKTFVQPGRHGAGRRGQGADRPAVSERHADRRDPDAVERRHRLVLEDRLQRGHGPLLARRAAGLRAHRQPAGRSPSPLASIPAPRPTIR